MLKHLSPSFIITHKQRIQRITFLEKVYKYMGCCKCRIVKSGINWKVVFSFWEKPGNYYVTCGTRSLYSTPCWCLLSTDLSKDVNRSLQKQRNCVLKLLNSVFNHIQAILLAALFERSPSTLSLRQSFKYRSCETEVEISNWCRFGVIEVNRAWKLQIGLCLKPISTGFTE